ncbi:hypothetical protein SESBI_38365, partial [Sesbania bispinosa]
MEPPISPSHSGSRLSSALPPPTDATIPNNVAWAPPVTGSQEGGRGVSGVACDGFANGEWLGWQRLAATHGGGGGHSGTDCSFRCGRGEAVELAAGTGR